MEHPKNGRSEIKSHGVRLLLSNHNEIRKLKKKYIPSNHGHKVWPTSWLLIDYLEHNGIKGERVLDMACGWGLSGIFCAKVLKSKVTWLDGDEDVYPYLKLQAEKNEVEADFIHMDIEKVGRKILRDVDVVIASDICFSGDLIDPLRKFLNRAKNASVSQVYISDPGRWPFYDLAELFENNKGTELIDWKVDKPVKVEGNILKLTF